MADSNDSNTVQLSTSQLTKGYPAIVDSHFTAALNKAKSGGQGTQDYFNALNETSDFWSWLAQMYDTGQNAWIPGVDSQGRQVMMVQYGNIQMQLLAHLPENSSVTLATTGDSDDDSGDTPLTATTTIRTGNTTNMTSQSIGFLVTVVRWPVGMVLSRTLVNSLLSPLYKNTKTWISNAASSSRKGASEADPLINAEEESQAILGKATGETEAVEGAIIEGVEYVAVDWLAAVGSVAGLVILTALPLVIKAIGHTMSHTLQINNLTDIDFTWNLDYQAHGQPSVQPSDKSIPKEDFITDMFGDSSTVEAAYQANFTFINSTDLSSIGYVIGLKPSDGGKAASLMVSVPWAGNNSIWVGNSSSDGESIYDDHSVSANQKLSQVATFGNYQITISLNLLSGTTNGEYTYSSIAVIEPHS